MKYKNEKDKRYLANLKMAVDPIEKYLLDPDVTDIWVNPDGNIFIKKFCQGRQYTEKFFIS